MGFRRTGLAVCLLLGGMTGAAEAAAPARKPEARTVAKAQPTSTKRRSAAKPIRRIAATGGISCVPYARLVTGMAVSGNGGQWWYNAAGRYSRDNTPMPGSVLAFRSSGGMARGHVAVVSRVVSSRQLQIDHANWAGPGIRRGAVMHDVNVIDVSERNDWTAVRVQVGHDRDTFGRTYPTFGFIHNRPAETLWADAPRRILTEIAEAPASGR